VPSNAARSRATGRNEFRQRTRASAWSRPERRDNALVATDVDVDAFTALFAERVLSQLDR
jgi:hypothetical protein